MSTAAIAVLPLIGVLIGAGFQFLANRALEQRRQLGQLRAEAYADYFRAVSAMSNEGRNPSNLRDLADAKSRICLYGTSGVVKQLGESEEHGADMRSDSARKALIGLVEEARKDTACRDHPVARIDLERILLGPDRQQ
jgi:hypothetical protein